MLATRVIHYTNREVVFECNAGYRCECDGMQKITPHSIKFLQDRMFKTGSHEVDNSTRAVIAEVAGIDKLWGEELCGALETENSSLRYYEAWSFFAQRYSHTRLTYQEDILPALSSLAYRVQRETLDEYLAGMWKQDISGCFLWITYSFSNESQRAKTAKAEALPATIASLDNQTSYVAPSLSWASRVGKIR
jgi:hypothetical protein